MKRALLNFCSYLIMLALLLWIFAFMMPAGQFELLRNFTAADVAILLFLSLGAYVGNGLEYYRISANIGFRMDRRDIVLLPLAMNLAGTLLPFQGAMAYQMFFFKKKYGVALSHGLAIAGFLYLLTMTISGIAGVMIFALGESSSWLFLGISVVFVGAAPLAVGMLLCCRNFRSARQTTNRIVGFIRTVLEDIAVLLKDLRTLVVLVLIYLLRLLSMIVMFAWIARCLGFEVSFSALLLLNLWNMLSLLLKVTPNNLGISQLVSGVMFAMIDMPKEQGVMISFAATLIFLLMALSFGVLALGCGLWDISRRAGTEK